METNRLIDGLAAGTLSRRNLLKGLSALGIGVTMVPYIPGRARAAGQATYFTWADYEVPELHGDYIKKHGAAPESSFFADEGENLRDTETGSIWSRRTGVAVDGPLKGTSLENQVGIVSYARAWKTFHPDSQPVMAP